MLKRIVGINLLLLVAVIGPLLVATVGRTETVRKQSANPQCQPYLAIVDRGDFSPELRRRVASTIPFDKLPQDVRASVSRTVVGACFFRRLPTCVIACDPRLYDFLVEHPDTLVAMWRLGGATGWQMQQLEPGLFLLTDPAGTRCEVRCVYRDYKRRIFFAEGTYPSPVLRRKLNGRAVLVLTNAYIREPDGRYFITVQMDAFVAFDQLLPQATTVAMYPFVAETADNNFTRCVMFLTTLWAAGYNRPDAFRQLPFRLEGITPEVRHQLARLCDQLVAVRYGENQTRATKSVSSAPTGRG